MKEFIIVLIIVFGILLITYIIGGIIAFTISTKKKKPDNVDVDIKKVPDSWKKYYQDALLGLEWANKQGFETLSIINDNLKLYGYLFNNNSDKTIILIHGYGSSARYRFIMAKVFFEKGFNVFVPDLRSHGYSEGKYITMGYYEKFDILKWIDVLNEKYSLSTSIIIEGVSMGAATSLQLLGLDLPKNVKGIIADCGYTSAYDEFKYQLQDKIGKIAHIITPLAFLLIKWIAKYDVKKASSIEGVKNSKVPILFIHGMEDKFVPYEMVDEIYKNCASKKDILRVEKATHALSHLISPELYEEKMFDFINKSLE